MNSMPSGLICTHNAHIANAGPNVNKYESHNHAAKVSTEKKGRTKKKEKKSIFLLILHTNE